MERRDTKKIAVGNTFIGGDSKITVQSMLNVPSTDIEGSVKQAAELEKAGCEIIRIAVPDLAAVKLIPAIKKEVGVPIVADIHFDYKIALESAAAGVDKIRINPGNIGDESRVKQVADECRKRNIPIRIGVNSGSLEKHILAKYGKPTPQALCDSAMYHAGLLEKFDFDNIVLSMKSSNVEFMVKAYELAAEQCKYPLHLGVTEAGTERMGIIKSSVGIGSLTRINLIEIAKQAEERLKDCKKNITVAIMGCAVNGPGEAREADIGIAGGIKEGLIFKKGEIVRKVPEEKLLDELVKEIEKMD